MAPLNSGIKRRTFLKVLGTAAVALALPSAPAPTPLTFHAKAFGMVWDVPMRYEVRYGHAVVRPDLVVRLLS